MPVTLCRHLLLAVENLVSRLLLNSRAVSLVLVLIVVATEIVQAVVFLPTINLISLLVTCLIIWLDMSLIAKH